MSHGPKVFPQMRIDSFMQGNEDLDFQNDNPPYVKLFVAHKYLNVRDGPNFGNIVGTVFQGQKLHIYARKGDWLAIKRNSKKLYSEDMWVHKEYLTPRSPTRVSSDNLEVKCHFSNMAVYLEGERESLGCKSVKNYLAPHNYTHPYRQKLLQWLKANNRTKAFNMVSSNCY